MDKLWQRYMKIVIKEILEAERKHKEINKICESFKGGDNRDTVTYRRTIMNREKLIQQDTATVIALAIHFAEEVEETLKFVNQNIDSDNIIAEEVEDCQLNTAKIKQFLKELQSRGE